jgi:hypothetical protein
MRIPADLKQLASPAARRARRKRGRQFVKDLPRGFAKDAIDTVKGLKQSAIGIWKLTAGALIDPKDAAARWKLVGKVTKEIIKHPSILGKALVSPYVEAWKSGHPGEAVGRVVFEIVAALAVGDALSKLTHSLDRAGKLLNLAANSADDIAQAAARIGLAADEVTAHK